MMAGWRKPGTQAVDALLVGPDDSPPPTLDPPVFSHRDSRGDRCAGQRLVT